MLAAAAVGNTVSKDEFNAAEPELRRELIDAQYDLKEADFGVVVVIAGDDRQAGNELVNRLSEWMDTRLVRTHVLAELRPDEAERPWAWRLWMALPPKGRSAIWAGGLMRQVAARLQGEIDDLELERWCRHLRTMQAELVADGALVVKFYLHTPADVQRERLAEAEKDPTRGWWVDERDWAMVDHLEDGVPTVERVLRATSMPGAPWVVVEATDERYRDLHVARTLLAAIRARMEQGPAPGVVSGAADVRDPDQQTTVLSTVDLSKALEKGTYKKRLRKRQAQLHKLADEAHARGISTVLAFEGADAAGKGGAIRRVTQALEAGMYRVVPVAAPTAEERQYQHLWRFWRDLPRAGEIVIFDRTWYGRVLVERVEGFATEAEWQRAYDEIVDFEEQLIERGIALAKFWLHISPEEQLARFKAREDIPYKQYKITEEDYRNRDRWDDYVHAIDDMVLRTSSTGAPWTLVPAEDKYYARVTVLETVISALKGRLRTLP
jgi:polyphosphate:AMP phosphotransferase